MSWEKVKLGEICKLVTGKTPPTKNEEYFSDELMWLTPADFTDKYIKKTQRGVSFLAKNKKKINLIPPNSLFITCIGNIGKLTINRIESCSNQQITALCPIQNNVTTEYLYYYLQTIQKNLIAVANNAVVPIINNGTLKEIEIPLPPLPIQEKIAAILDKADELRRKDQELLKKYDELAQAIFIDMFGDPVKNEKGWEVKPFNYFVSFETNMTTDFNRYAHLPHIGVGNIEKDTGNLVNYKLVGNENLQSGKYLFSSENIIYSKIRPNLNKVALPNFEGLCSADAYPLKPTHNSNRIFFSFLLKSDHFLDFISSFSNRANIPKVNKEQLRKYAGIAPPLHLQEVFAKKIELINQLKAQANAEKSEELFQSLLQQAFKGDIML